MLFAFYDPKTKDVRVISTDEMPAIIVLSVSEEESVAKVYDKFLKKGKMRAHLFCDVRKTPLIANAGVFAKMEQKLKAALERRMDFHAYVDGMTTELGGEQKATPQDISLDFARGKDN